jgi:8-oxo-dGTP pyrophosphatase MutT (NUDIX family)
MQVGGHGDAGELDPFAIALREAEEETGLRDLVAFPLTVRPTPLQVGVVDVGATASEPAHRHGDIRYVMATSSPESIVPESDDTPLRWCTIPEATDLVNEENLRVLLRRTFDLLAGVG